jgi:hypothetical protein
MSDTMKTRMTAMALLDATMAIRRYAAPERHHATSGARATLFTLHHVADEAGEIPAHVVRAATGVTAAEDVRAVG